MLRRTSRKLLAKLGAQQGSHQLVLNAPLNGVVSASSRHSTNLNRKTKRNKKSKREAAASEALLLAAKNYLPPVQFHHVHGPNAQLSKNKFVARRTQSFCQALVFSNRVILPNERVYIKVLEISKGWSGTIRFGFTSVDPATLSYQMPKHACPDMTNAGHTWARALADEVVRRNSVIHFSYNTNGYIHYGINNQDCGIFYANVNTSQHLWFIVDIYGLTTAVELIDPRIHNASSEQNLSSLGERRTMFKSTSAMDDLLTPYGAHKKKRSRKSARRAALMQEQWSTPDGLLMTSSLRFPNYQTQQALLPNLSSIVLPATQQNIYSPMPSLPNQSMEMMMDNNNNEPPHDYYQIMTNNKQVANMTHETARSSSSFIPAVPISSSALFNSSSTSAAAAGGQLRSNSRLIADEREICHQLDALQMSDINCNAQSNHQQQQQQQQQHQSPSKSTKSTSTGTMPVAATRRGQHSLANTCTQTTNLKRSQTETNLKDNIKINHHLPINSPLSPSATCQTRVRNSINSRARTANLVRGHKQSTASSRNDNIENNPPPSKDCPICFERPINCVLYQCGHMCTCYECGVKQWKTQSRTCPICRTVIKDVIKTYMS